MPHATFDAARGFDADRFRTVPIHEDDHAKTLLAFLRPGQFVPVHAPAATVTIAPRSGRARVREGDRDREVGPGDVVVVPAGVKRGVEAVGETPFEALFVTAPPPGEAAHEPVRRGIENGKFEP